MTGGRKWGREGGGWRCCTDQLGFHCAQPQSDGGSARKSTRGKPNEKGGVRSGHHDVGDGGPCEGALHADLDGVDGRAEIGRCNSKDEQAQ